MENNRLYDLVIIGAGPGGYVAAERAGSKGKKVLLVEKADLGGICLNAGCIPSKTLINSGKLFSQACNSDIYGVTVENPRFDLTKAMAYKQKVIKTLRNGVGFQMKQHQVDIITGEASFIDQRTIQVNGDQYQAENVIIATGASPVLPPISGLDEAHVVTSKEILEVDKLPNHLVVIGGGAIGCEFASFFSNVGVQVSLIEILPEIISPLDGELAGMLRKSIKGVNFHLESKVERITANSVVYSQNGESKNMSCDMVLVSVGRKPNVEGLGLENIDIDFDQHGIKVN
ncbi:MAG: NAD(P)/FAD-dependent oxidoreductase, partial [Candidatus Poribacteria bacterium]|nr:NAD(P)/FAD-dependent oxidoreductase [Candidatus Poribacteria bacterium]